jgi:hypothetical protein
MIALTQEVSQNECAHTYDVLRTFGISSEVLCESAITVLLANVGASARLGIIRDVDLSWPGPRQDCTPKISSHRSNTKIRNNANPGSSCFP